MFREFECISSVQRSLPIENIWKAEVMLDFLIVLHFYGEGRKKSVVINYYPSLEFYFLK